MEIKLINGHNQIVFSHEEQQDIESLYLSGKSIRYIMNKYNVTQKPIVRYLDSKNIDHHRGNLRAYIFKYPNGIYDENEEIAIQNTILNIELSSPKHYKYSINSNYFDVIDTQDKAYILGFLFADGNNSLDKFQVTMTLEEGDGEILDKINKCLEYDRPKSFKNLTNKHDFGYTYKNQYGLGIYDKRISTILNLRGVIPNKSLKLEFPKWLNPNLYSHFIRGYFDGDGSIYVRQFKTSCSFRTAPVVTITSTQSFCEAISDICAKYLEIKSRIYDASCHNGVTKVFQLNGSIVCKKFLDWLYNDAHLYLQRKYDRYSNYYKLNNSLIA